MQAGSGEDWDDPRIATRVDVVLRSLAAAASAAAVPLPKLITAVAGGVDLRLQLAEPAVPLVPFTASTRPASAPSSPPAHAAGPGSAAASGPGAAPAVSPARAATAWQLDRHAPLLDPATAARQPAPYPALVPLGRTSSGDLLLVNLEAAGAIGLVGASLDTTAVLTALALDLARWHAADDVRVVLVGFGDHLAHALPARLHHSPDLDTALEHLAELAGRRLAPVGASAGHDQSLRASPAPPHGADRDSNGNARRAPGHAPASAHLRARAGTGGATVLLVATPITPTQQQRLATVAGAQPLSAVTAVVASALPIHPSAWPTCRISVSSAPTTPTTLPAELGPAGVDPPLVRLHRCDPLDLVPEEPGDIEGAAPLPTARPSGPVARSGPAAPAPTATEPAVGSGIRAVTAPTLQVLGPVAITGVDLDAVDEAKRPRLIELAVHAMLLPDQSGEQISKALGNGDRPWPLPILRKEVAQLRAWLGTDPTDGDYLSVTSGDRCRLGPAVRCDWIDFQDLARAGIRPGSPDIAALTRALDLVRGQPFAAVPARRYDWAARIAEEMRATVVDVAHTLALAHLRRATDLGRQGTARGEFDAARRALQRGLRADPHCQLLYRDLCLVEDRAGNPRAIAAIQQHLGTTAAPETATLLHRLLARR